MKSITAKAAAPMFKRGKGGSRGRDRGRGKGRGRMFLPTTVVCVLVIYFFASYKYIMQPQNHEDTNLRQEISQLIQPTEKHLKRGIDDDDDVVINSENRPSLDILLDAVRSNIHRPIPYGNILYNYNDTDDTIDPVNAMELCNSVKCDHENCLSYNNTTSGRTYKRRIFAGGLIADESWHIIGSSALEMFGIFHSIVFVESNRTQSYEPRKLRFIKGSEDHTLLTSSGIYGPSTNVYVHHFVHEVKVRPMAREHMMRNSILGQWKKLGMTRDDIGLIMDPDEIATSRTLRALQICEVGKKYWDSSSNQNCSSPMVALSVPYFEGSPLCIHKNSTSKGFAKFRAPTMVIGACIEGIGDSNMHIVAPRTKLQGRQEGYGQKGNYSAVISKMKTTNKLYPLYNAADFRKMPASVTIYGGAGFHIHNFFDSIQKLRWKYAFYGHKHENSFDVPFGAINAQTNVFTKCLHNASDDGDYKQRLENGLKILEDQFALPVAFQLPGYVEKRHEEVMKMLEEDEREYGRADRFDGRGMYKEYMLTHPGRRHLNNSNE